MIADGTILNTVKTYVEQVGRNRSVKHWNELDRLECIFTGPTATVESWIPKVGQTHPDYPSMTFDSAELVNEAALVTELRCVYVGKYYGIGPVAKGQSIQWGESGYVQYASYTTTTTPGEIQDDGSTSPPTNTYEFISFNWAIRYQLEVFTYKALSRKVVLIGRPGGGVLSQYSYRTGRISSSTGMGLVNSQVSFPIVLIDQQANCLNNGWYELNETWGPRATIDTQIFDITIATAYSTTDLPQFPLSP